MQPIEIVAGIYSVGVIDWDRRLFDSLIPTPNGTSYNAFVVKGSQATALVETVEPQFERILQENLTALSIERLDYIILNHIEQDHSGTAPAMLARYPMAKAVVSNKGADLAKLLLHLPEDRLLVVNDGDTISLGNRTFEFISAPWVHWPETMLTYLREDKILFSTDLFGSHLATSDIYAGDRCLLADSAKRYYAQIMMPFAKQITKHLERLAGYKIDKIFPSHGPCHNDPGFIIDLYKEWAGGEPHNYAVVAYVSMHDSTRLLTEHLVDALQRHGIRVQQFELNNYDSGSLAMSLVDAATVLVGSPTVLAGPHPAAVYATVLLNALRPKTKFIGIYGSYGWATRMDQQLAALLTNVKVETYDTLLVKGLPRAEDYAAVEHLADALAQKHREAGLV